MPGWQCSWKYDVCGRGRSGAFIVPTSDASSIGRGERKGPGERRARLKGSGGSGVNPEPGAAARTIWYQAWCPSRPVSSHGFQNLLSNSIKHRKLVESPRIEIWAAKEDDRWVIAGAG